MLRVPLALFVAAALPSAVAAQSELPRFAIGGAVSVASSDADKRMRLFEVKRSPIIMIDANARIVPRVAVGIELTQFDVARAGTSGRSFRATGEQRERALLGVVRGRAGGNRIAVDLIGGAGILSQHHEAAFTPCFTGCEVASTTELEHRAPVFAFGAEMPIRVAPHIVVAPFGRYYFLRRGNNLPSGPTDLLPWQFEYRSSQRATVGGLARVVW